MNQEEIILDATTARVVDLLEQIKRLNTMIALHRNESEDDFMRLQYEHKKSEMIHELECILHEFRIEAHLLNAA
jgi:hypothetical protein